MEIFVPGQLNCDTSTILLTTTLSSDYTITDIIYVWDTPTGSSGIDTYFATEGGFYEVTAFVTIENLECIVEASNFVEIDTIAPLVAFIEDMHLDCNDLNQDNYIEIIAIGSDLQYNWYFDNNFLSTEESILVTGEGTYVINLIDLSNGCETFDSSIVTFSQDYPTINFNTDTLDCETTSFIMTASLSSNVDSSYWTYGGNFISNENDILVSSPGIYEITAVSGSGCMVTQLVEILLDTIHPSLVVNDATIPCDAGEIQLDVESFNTTNFSWSGPQLIDDNIVNPLVNVGGTYYVNAINNKNHCKSIDSILVTDLGFSPELELTGDILNCYHDQVNILLDCDQEDASFSWFNSGIQIDNNQNLNINLSGLYLVEAVSPTGCTSFDSILIIEDFTLPQIMLSADSFDCYIDQVQIYSDLTDADYIEWINPNGDLLAGEDPFTNISGVHIIEVTNESSGCINRDSIEVIDISNYPDFELRPDTLNCYKNTINLGLVIQPGYESLNWTFPNGNLTQEISPGITSGGIYNLHIEVEGNCDIDTSLMISENFDLPEISIDHGYLDCYDPSTFITIDLMTLIDGMEITSPTNITYQSSTIETEEAGVFLISVTGNNGCQIKDSVEILGFFDQPEGLLENSGPVTCSNPQIDLTISVTENNMLYSWSGPGITQENNDEVSIDQGGNYFVTITNEHGCSSIFTTVTEEFTAIPGISVSGHDITCYQTESTLIFSSNETNIESIAWYNDEELITGNNDMTTDEEGYYYAEIINIYGCSNRDSIFIQKHNDPPEIVLLSEQPLIILTDFGNRDSIETEVIDEVSYSIDWSPREGLSCYDCPNPMVMGGHISPYTIEVINKYGCIDELEVDLRYKHKTKVFIPNIFTPNLRDGVNDFFSLFANDNVINIDQLLIYDRWGELLFKKNDFVPNIPELGWDGTFNGRNALKGVYVYYFIVTTIDEEKLKFSGDITIY